MANAPGSNNDLNVINTSPLLSAIQKTFTDSPNFNQIFESTVVSCVQENTLNDCEPISDTQFDHDIQRADDILEWLLVNDYPDRDTVTFYMETLIRFFKAKKCVNQQYPCWAHGSYLSHKQYLTEFDFVAA